MTREPFRHSFDLHYAAAHASLQRGGGSAGPLIRKWPEWGFVQLRRQSPDILHRSIPERGKRYIGPISPAMRTACERMALAVNPPLNAVLMTAEATVVARNQRALRMDITIWAEDRFNRLLEQSRDGKRERKAGIVFPRLNGIDRLSRDLES